MFIYCLCVEAGDIIAQLRNGQWTPQASHPVLFVQIDSSAGKTVNESLNMIAKLGQKTDSALQAAELGSMVSGNLSKGGLNMIYGVDNIEEAIPVLLNVLARNGVNKNVRIARRVNINIRELDWFYEVIYPADFSGVFVTW